MQWILNRSDLGFQMTRNFSGNILIMGGDSFNDSSLDLCEMILNYSPNVIFIILIYRRLI